MSSLNPGAAKDEKRPADRAQTRGGIVRTAPIASQADCRSAATREGSSGARTCERALRARARSALRCAPSRRSAIPSGHETDVATRIAQVRARIARAAERAGRDPAEVALVVVSKTASVEETLAAVRGGATDLGENRVEALIAKSAALEAAGLSARRHLIGTLQTNKVRRALPVTDVLHSVDRLSLVEVLVKNLAPPGPPLRAFIQVNVSGEETKGGFDEETLWPALDAAARVPRLELAGLMTMAPLCEDPESSRPIFRRLRELRDEARRRRYPVGLGLSMGMTQDFEVAIQEGATTVRVGSAIFSTHRS